MWWLCACVDTPLPSVEEVLNSIAEMAHCTQTHCVDDSVATVLPSGVGLTPLQVAMMGALMGAAILLHAATPPVMVEGGKGR